MHRMPNLLIVGRTNNCKTMIIDRFLESQKRRGSAPPAIVPIVSIQAPPKTGGEMVLCGLLFRRFEGTHTQACLFRFCRGPGPEPEVFYASILNAMLTHALATVQQPAKS